MRSIVHQPRRYDRPRRIRFAVARVLPRGTVWTKSAIDLVLVTIDDKKVEVSDVAINSNGVNVHVLLLRRTEFRKAVEGSIHHSFMHSFLSKGRLLCSHDPTIADLCGG